MNDNSMKNGFPGAGWPAGGIFEAMEQLRGMFEQKVAAPRMARGDVRAAVLALLAEQPMHGYQIIQQIDERSGGSWKPSPGSVYPTLQMLADEGLVRSEPEGGKNVFHLTDSGRRAAAQGDSAPWDAVAGDGATVDVRRTIAQLAMAFKQVTHTGTVDQVERATRILNDARKAIYGILAEDPSETGSS